MIGIENGSEVTSITINGDIATYGDNVTSYIVEQGGSPGILTVGGQSNNCALGFNAYG